MRYLFNVFVSVVVCKRGVLPHSQKNLSKNQLTQNPPKETKKKILTLKYLRSKSISTRVKPKKKFIRKPKKNFSETKKKILGNQKKNYGNLLETKKKILKGNQKKISRKPKKKFSETISRKQKKKMFLETKKKFSRKPKKKFSETKKKFSCVGYKKKLSRTDPKKKISRKQKKNPKKIFLDSGLNPLALASEVSNIDCSHNLDYKEGVFHSDIYSLC